MENKNKKLTKIMKGGVNEMEKRITLSYLPSPDAESTLHYGVVKKNPPMEGMGMSELVKLISEHVPESSNERTRTHKEVLYVERSECPCCPTGISAIVDVHLEGEWPSNDSSRGLYKVRIGTDWSEISSPEYREKFAMATIEKLDGTGTIYSEEQDALPKRDYSKGPSKD